MSVLSGNPDLSDDDQHGRCDGDGNERSQQPHESGTDHRTNDHENTRHRCGTAEHSRCDEVRLDLDVHEICDHEDGGGSWTDYQRGHGPDDEDTSEPIIGASVTKNVTIASTAGMEDPMAS